MPLPVGDRLRLAESAGRGQHDEPREILVLAPETIGHPGSHRWPARDGRPGVHEGVRGIVVDRFGHHRADNADLVGDGGDVGEDRADLLAARAAASERMLGREADELLALELGDGHALGERLGHGLAMHPGQVGLRVQGLQVRRAAGHVEIDDPLGLGGQVERMDDARPSVALRGRHAGLQQLGVEQRSQRQRADPGRRPAQERAAMDAFYPAIGRRIHGSVPGDRLVEV